MDLVTRLRYRSSTDVYPTDTALSLMAEAAIEIERLRKALSERLQHLEKARLCLQGITSCSTCKACQGAAELALRHQPQSEPTTAPSKVG